MFETINHHAAAYSAVFSRGQTGFDSAPLSRAESVVGKEEEIKNHQVRTEPEKHITGLAGEPRDSVELTQEAEEIRQLQARDQEVRTHEAAHAAAGGAYAGAPSYSFKRGPDGGSYAVDGEVSIDVSAVSGDPEATLQKAQKVRAAALAPAEPSAQDMKVAQQAQAMAAEARNELAKQNSPEVENTEQAEQGSKGSHPQGGSIPQASAAVDFPSSVSPASSASISRLDIKA